MAITLEQAKAINGQVVEMFGRTLRFSLWVRETQQRLYVNLPNGKSWACYDIVTGKWAPVKNTSCDRDAQARMEVRIAEITAPAPVEEVIEEVVAVAKSPEAGITWAECPVAVEVPEVATKEATEMIVREGYEKMVVLGEVEARLKNHFICKKWSFFIGEERIGGADTWELDENATRVQLQAHAQSLLDYRADPPKPQPSTKTPAERLAWEIEMMNK